MNNIWQMGIYYLVMLPISLVYSILLKVNKRFSSSKRFLQPVISVGNITWGGTGKTPIVIELLNFLIENNLKPVVLTRGYSRNCKVPIILKNGVDGATVLDSGDEPFLIAKSVPKADVIVGACRYDNALRFEKETNPDIYVLDDGFQHWSIQRDLDIVCINAANPFGNGMLIPAGILREKPISLKRSGLIVITNSDMITNEELLKLEETIFDLSGKIPVITYYGGFKYKTIDLDTDFNCEPLKKFDVYSLSAIGFSEGFKNSIRKSGIDIKGSIILRDHSDYDKDMLESIVNENGKNSYFIITAKDAVKIQNISTNLKEKMAVLTVKPQFIVGREQWEQEVLKSLQFF
jgi:tetraacyldisaccharide 4'-kinase